MKNWIVFTLLCLLATGLQAAPINFQSGDGVNEGNSITNPNVVITAHPLWMTLARGKWISYDQTGDGGIIISPNATPGNPTAVFYELLPAGMSMFKINVLADDTAGVYLRQGNTRTELKAPNYNQDGACAAGDIGCEWGENWTGTFSINPQQTYRLEFDLYQRGGGPMGLNYEGVADVPEPTTYGMLGGGLLLLGYLGKRRKRASNG